MNIEELKLNKKPPFEKPVSFLVTQEVYEKILHLEETKKVSRSMLLRALLDDFFKTYDSIPESDFKTALEDL